MTPIDILCRAGLRPRKAWRILRALDAQGYKLVPLSPDEYLWRTNPADWVASQNPTVMSGGPDAP